MDPTVQGCIFELKKVLTSAPVLFLPNCCAKFVLDIDASADGLVAVLSQVVRGKGACHCICKPNTYKS